MTNHTVNDSSAASQQQHCLPDETKPGGDVDNEHPTGGKKRSRSTSASQRQHSSMTVLLE